MAGMANSTDLSREKACELVKKIALSHGYIPAETLAAMSPEVRLVVEEALRNKDDMIASSVFTLARNLYTSNARFIWELLQNADDNHYSQAGVANVDPYISFSIYHDRLVMECNEDGFTEENLKAICNIGKSSKSGAQGYIGEKGIGFKSTFMAAWKVQIQSGPFSFYFQHREGDSGMGMVTPIWFEPQMDLLKPSTRISLYFHDNGAAENLRRRRDEITKQLWNLQGTVLLFLKNLRSIKITAFDEDQKPTRSRQTTMVRNDFASLVQLHNVEHEGASSKKTMHQFYVTSHLARNLTKNENRTYTEAEEETKAYSTAEVVLAFPLDDNDEPIIEAQELFAFMPVRKVGFNFLIQSDFVTQANRQDIVTTSQRNIGLRKAIGDAFVTSVQQLCNHPKLQYKWMRYLPRKDRLPLDFFWKDLVSYLSSVLHEKPILRARRETFKALYRITELGRLNGIQLDKEGNPLFPDLPVQRYLSVAYHLNDLDVLGEYGLQYLQIEDIVPRIEAFVGQPDWKSKVYQGRDEDWHSRAAKLMMQAWEDKSQDWKGKLRALPLLPLRSVTFQSSTSEGPKVFFPDLNGIPIPQDINLSMILPAAAANSDCRRLYKVLGTATADPEKVRELIIDKHRFWKQRQLDIMTSRSHLQYLYLMHPQNTLVSEEQASIIVFDHKERPKQPKKEYVYLPGEDEWSPGKLLEPAQNVDFQELDVSFVHPKYLVDQPLKPNGFEKSWIDWLFDIIWLEVKVQLFTKPDYITDEPKEFSEEWLWVVKHKSGKAIGRFNQNWQKPRPRSLWEADEYGTKLARELEVLCMDNTRHPLQSTFIPLPALVARCEHLLSDINGIPFLKLESPLQDSDIHEWASFGKHFGIGVADDLNFSLAILQAIIYGDSKTKVPLTQAILELYLRIHAQCLASDDKKEAQHKVREFFEKNCGVLCSPQPPNSASGDNLIDPEWASPQKCLWDAPAHISVSIPLKSIWETVLVTLDLQDRENLEQLFHHTLLIRDVTYNDILSELRNLSEPSDPGSESQDLGFIHEMYKTLAGLKKSMDEPGLILMKEIFAQEPLLYVPSDQPWRRYKVPECIWSSERPIADKACLEPHYPDLAELFVDCLGVPKLSFAMVYEELVEIRNNTPTTSYVKNLLWSINALLPSGTGTRPPFANEVASCRIFPIKMPDGDAVVLSSQEDFAVVDRQHYADTFKDKLKVLDFSLDEVRHLRPMIEWAGLEDRCLSRLVVEKTVVDDELCIQNRSLTRDLIRKSKAFVSIAAHFDSPLVSFGPDTMYSALRNTKVFTAEAITSTLIISQDGQDIMMPISNSELHIQTANNGGFEIYIPADEGARDFCFASRLPWEFAACLLKCKSSSVHSQAVSVVASVIHAKPSSTGRILEANGIIELDLPLLYGEDDVDDEPTLCQEAITISGFGNHTTSAEPNSRAVYEAARPPSRFEQQGNEEYRLLLIQVAKIARVISFPNENSVSGVSPAPEPLPGTSANQRSFGFYIGDQTEWRRMVGAAGELFVFELLSALRPTLPDFNCTNWQSTVRRHVNFHPDYSNLGPWNGAETSDILYSDKSGLLTTLFIQKGYLDNTWIGEKPEYFIEVKTTMSSELETPFYLSKYQYSTMQNLSGGSSPLPHQRKKIYTLFRVYGLESGSVGLKIYIDPENARKHGQLEFEADGWTVTPRKRMRTQQTQNRGERGPIGSLGTSRDFAIDLEFGSPNVPVFGSTSSA